MEKGLCQISGRDRRGKAGVSKLILNKFTAKNGLYTTEKLIYQRKNGVNEQNVSLRRHSYFTRHGTKLP